MFPDTPTSSTWSRGHCERHSTSLRRPQASAPDLIWAQCTRGGATGRDTGVPHESPDLCGVSSLLRRVIVMAFQARAGRAAGGARPGRRPIPSLGHRQVAARRVPDDEDIAAPTIGAGGRSESSIFWSRASEHVGPCTQIRLWPAQSTDRGPTAGASTPSRTYFCLQDCVVSQTTTGRTQYSAGKRSPRTESTSSTRTAVTNASAQRPEPLWPHRTVSTPPVARAPLRSATARGWGCTGQGLSVLHETPTPVEYTRMSANSAPPSCSTDRFPQPLLSGTR